MASAHYIACFFAGAFLANVVPHFVSGISGNKFPTPFAKPSGRGLSSAPVNMVWSLFNLLIGFLLFRTGHINGEDTLSLVLFFAGIVVMGILLSIHFQHKHTE